MKHILSKLLEFYGPSIRSAELEVLGLKLPRTFKHVFYDDGFVDSVDDRTNWLMHLYNVHAEPEKEASTDAAIRGKHYELPVTVTTEGEVGNWMMAIETKAVVHHIFYEPPRHDDEMYNDMSRILLRAHEETHVVHGWGALSRLEKKIRREQKKRIDLRAIDDIEVIAQVGAIYALVKNGYSTDDIERFSKRFIMAGFREALELYRDC